MMEQIELRLYPPGTWHECLFTYLREQCEGLAADTRRDYRDRATWCATVIAPTTPIRDITIVALQDVVREHGPKGGGLLNVTLRKRIGYGLAALGYAAARGLIDPQLIPQIKWLKLRDDGTRGKVFLTVAQYEDFRAEIPEGRFRRFADLGFWTGHHSRDIRTMRKDHLDPNFVWRDDRGKEIGRGRYWRRNHKNKRVFETWFPMEPEFRLIVLGWFKEFPHWRDNSAVVAKTYNMAPVFNAAAERARVPRVKPNLDLRRSFATMLAARGYPNEYVRQALGHEGEISTKGAGEKVAVETLKPSTATRHYLRPSPDLMKHAISKRKR
jgi:integrase